MVAKTTDGTLVPIALGVDATEASRALAALGYEDALTAEAWASAQASPRLAAASDPVRSVVSILLSVAPHHLDRRPRLGAPARRHPRHPRPAGSTPAGVVRRRPSAARRCGRHERLGRRRRAERPARGRRRLRRGEARADRGHRLPARAGALRPPRARRSRAASCSTARPAPARRCSPARSRPRPAWRSSTSRARSSSRSTWASGRAGSATCSRRPATLGRAVIFVDEFDALAKARGGTNGHEERETTLNQLLVELDGFTPADDIVVMAATNRLDVLDAAVLRPGRFNRKIHVGLPDVARPPRHPRRPRPEQAARRDRSTSASSRARRTASRAPSSPTCSTRRRS